MEMKDKAVAMKDKAMAMKDKAVAMKDKAMEMKDKAVAMKDKAMEMKDKAVAMKDKAMEMKDKVMEMKDKAVAAKDKVVAMKDEALLVKDKFLQETRNNISGLASNAKDAMSKVKAISGETQKPHGHVSEVADNQSISEDSDSIDSAESTNAINENLENTYEQDESAIAEQQQEETVDLVSSANYGKDEKEENIVESDQDEATFSEEVIAKIDKLIPAKEVIDQLKIISFDGQIITNDDIPYLVERLKKFASEGIKKVSLSFRKSALSSNGAMQILEGLKTYPQFISGLTFSGNALGDEGAVSIASNLSNFPMLKYLFFSDMGITGDGAVAILSMIGNMSKNDDGTSIQLIDLSNNQISDEYLDTLVKCWDEVKDNEEMTLMLQGNPFKTSVSIDVPSNIKLTLK